MTTNDWRHRAECRNEDAALFFPDGNTGPALLQIEEAKAVCRRCPVIEQCLTWAMDTRQEHGVWGGLSEAERRSMRRKRMEARGCGTERGYRIHSRRRETPCGPCQKAYDRAIAAQRRQALEREHEKGGTSNGARIHFRLGESACDRCAAAAALAKRDDNRDRRARKSAAKQADPTPKSNRDQYEQQLTARKTEIAQRRLAGDSPSVLAIEYDISDSRVRQIVRWYRASLQEAA